MNKINNKIWTLWILTVFFFSYQFVLRLTPGVLIEEIMIKYQINASTFGLAISLYYIGYAGMQIPVGIFLDRYGVRNIVAISSLICVLGNITLIFSSHWLVEMLSRFLVGIGSAAGALGAIHCIRLYFPRRHMSQMIGLTITISLLGAIYGKSINRYLVSNFGMDKSILYLCIPGIIISLFLFIFIKNSDIEQNKTHSYNSAWISLKEIFKNSQIMWLAIAGALMVGPLESFADVFGEAYLVTVYNFTPSDAGYLTASAIYFGFCMGAPLLAGIADRFNCHYIINIICGIVMATAFHLILENLITEFSSMLVCTLIIGIMSSYQVIVISSIANLAPPQLSGVAIAVANMFNMAAGTGFNAAIGGLLDLYWTGEITKGKRIYSEIAYSDALYIIPVTLMFGVIIFFIIKPNKSELSAH